MDVENLTEEEKKELQRIVDKMNRSNFGYPIYKKNRDTTLVVKFKGFDFGEVVVAGEGFAVGDIIYNLVEHTHFMWEDFDASELDKPKDKDLVWCWRGVSTHSRLVKFYDEKNLSTFTSFGERGGSKFDNYEVIPKENWPGWAYKAYETLED